MFSVFVLWLVGATLTFGILRKNFVTARLCGISSAVWPIFWSGEFIAQVLVRGSRAASLQPVPGVTGAPRTPSRKLLVVAGVSGSGKSTFIGQLRRNRLGRGITSALPADVAGWGNAENNPRLFDFLGVGRSPGGRIIHHEITHAFQPYLEHRILLGTHPDERLERLLDQSRQISIVIVGAPTTRLVHQLSVRSILLHVPAYLRPLVEWCGPTLQRIEKALPIWITANAGRFLGRRWRHRSRMRERNDKLLELYAKQGAVEAIYRHWADALLEKWGDRIKRPVLYVEPSDGPSARKQFCRVTPAEAAGWMRSRPDLDVVAGTNANGKCRMSR